MAEFRAALGDPDLIQFYDYWASLRGDRPMPSRKDVDPLRIAPNHLPNLMLIDVFHEPRRFKYRLVGTNVVEASGKNRTGRYFDDVKFFQINPTVMNHYNRVVETGQPLYSLEPFTNLRTGSNYDVERLLLPLSNDGQRVDMLIVFFKFKSGPHTGVP